MDRSSVIITQAVSNQFWTAFAISFVVAFCVVGLAVAIVGLKRRR